MPEAVQIKRSRRIRIGSRRTPFGFHLGMAYAGVPDDLKKRSTLEKAFSLNLSAAEAAEAPKALAALEGS